MGSGGGGGSYFPNPSGELEKLLRARAAQDINRQRTEGDVNVYLGKLTTRIAHDSEETERRIGVLTKAIEQEAEVDRVLFGGSVAKHTFVDGVSDVDLLVILPRSEARTASAAQFIEEFADAIRNNVPRKERIEVTHGCMAVTVAFPDGSEMQVLPAAQDGRQVRISDPECGKWMTVDPRKFARTLSKANASMGGALVPSIKLLKSAQSMLPEPKRLTGYHLESIAVEAVRNHKGAVTPKALVLRVLERASELVMAPMKDSTGQSRYVDEYLGAPGSSKRAVIRDGLAGLYRRLNAATSVDDWKSVLEGSE